jgi:hypothetical protein
VDRAALDVALELGIPAGGWCPRGRRAEDGVLADRYPLQETPTANYAERTEWNVRFSDGTLILTRGKPAGGTALTIAMARKWRKPCRIIDPADLPEARIVLAWLRRHKIQVLNVAGPRESSLSGISAKAAHFLRQLLC